MPGARRGRCGARRRRPRRRAAIRSMSGISSGGSWRSACMRRRSRHGRGRFRPTSRPPCRSCARAAPGRAVLVSAPSSSISAAEPSVEPSSTNTTSYVVSRSAAPMRRCSSSRPASSLRTGTTTETSTGARSYAPRPVSATATLRRRPSLAAAALYAVLALLFVAPALIPGRTLASTDLLWSPRPGPPSARTACAISAPTGRWRTRSRSSSRFWPTRATGCPTSRSGTPTSWAGGRSSPTCSRRSSRRSRGPRTCCRSGGRWG